MPPTFLHLEAEGIVETTEATSIDEHDYDFFMQELDQLDIDAATWVARKRNGLECDGVAELQTWLNADMRHRHAFDDMDAMFGDIQQLPDNAVGRLKAMLNDPLSSTAGQRKMKLVEQITRLPRRANWAWRLALGAFRPRRLLAEKVLASALMTVVFAGGFMTWTDWHQRPIFEKAYATQRGQLLNAKLPDTSNQSYAQGTSLQLDTSTQAEAKLYRDRREVRLSNGQAMFAVHEDTGRPFHVYAGSLKITVLGTRFSVRHTGTGLNAGQTVVAVEEGLVSVQALEPKQSVKDTAKGTRIVGADSVARVISLTAGQTVIADADGHLGPVTLAPSESIASWRSGRINFIQTPLAEAIAELERYGATALVVRDPVLAALPVGGSYSLTRWQSFAQALPSVLPVRLVRRGDVTEVVAR